MLAQSTELSQEAHITHGKPTWLEHNWRVIMYFDPIRPGLFWSSWACVCVCVGGGGGGFKSPLPPLHKSQSIDAIEMKLGG